MRSNRLLAVFGVRRLLASVIMILLLFCFCEMGLAEQKQIILKNKIPSEAYKFHYVEGRGITTVWNKKEDQEATALDLKMSASPVDLDKDNVKMNLFLDIGYVAKLVDGAMKSCGVRPRDIGGYVIRKNDQKIIEKTYSDPDYDVLVGKIAEVQISLPEESLFVGKSWDLTKTEGIPFGKEVDHYEFKIADIQKNGSDSIIKISVVETIKVFTEKERNGQVETAEGGYKGDATAFFSEEKGRVVKSDETLMGTFNIYIKDQKTTPSLIKKKLSLQYTEEGYEELK